MVAAETILLDLCCGAGGAAVGYARAGFTVIGVDIHPQPHYPFRFHQGDALAMLRKIGRTGQLAGDRIAAIHASPPCQRWSTSTLNPSRHPDLITPMRRLLIDTELPYVIENVPGAPLIDPVKLCGSSFGLRVRRHRMFESNRSLRGPACDHRSQGTPVGVYGHSENHQCLRPDGTQRGTKAASLDEAQKAMEIDWMEWRELTQAIPPAYTEHLGRQLIGGDDHGI